MANAKLGTVLVEHGRLTHILMSIETHASLTQAIAAIGSMLIAAAALIYTIRTLRLIQQQTLASIALTNETFRPIVEVLGGHLGQLPASSQIDFVNKGVGPALNFRWTEDGSDRWRSHSSNMIAVQEKGSIDAPVDWKKGLVLSYNSVAHPAEIRTYVKFGSTGSVSNQHDVRQGAAVTRLGWTIADPTLATPAWHPDLIAQMSWRHRLRHWWNLKRGRERRL